MSRIVPHPEAFSVGRTKQRQPRKKSEGHLAFLRTLSCTVCGDCTRIEAAHIRMASPLHGKRETGKAEKPSDMFAVPLCTWHHELQHRVGEDRFWGARRIDPHTLALVLFVNSGDEDLAEAVIRAHRK